MPSHDKFINYSQWILRIIGWDGILPVFVASLSVAVAFIFGNNRPLAETLMVVLPIVALLFRFTIGRKHIRRNYCGEMFKGIQTGALGLAVLILLFADFFVVLTAFIPKNRRHPPPEDVPIYIVALTIYLVLVVFAMYPGREPAEPRP